MDFTRDELIRYERQLALPGFGRPGQERLKGASVAIIGLGGLGCPSAQYLAGAGVGRLGLVDPDVVDLSNLPRQLLHNADGIGTPKVASAAAALKKINPHVLLHTHEVRLSDQNALDLLGDYDVVVDATDNFSARYLINDACHALKRPYVYGSVFQFEGMVTVFGGESGPCYRCLYPEPPGAGLVPNCREAGVLGVLPGLVGTLQAAEAIKLVTGIGEPLSGRLLFVDGQSSEIRSLALAKNPLCPLCGETPRIFGVREEIPSLSPCQVKARLDRGDELHLLDVRLSEEAEVASLGGTLIPLHELEQRLGELSPDREWVVYCHHGMRSLQGIRLLQAGGFSRLANLAGGIDAWSRTVDPSVSRY